MHSLPEKDTPEGKKPGNDPNDRNVAGRGDWDEEYAVTLLRALCDFRREMIKIPKVSPPDETA